MPEPGLQIPAFRLHTKPNRSDTHELPINTPAVSVLVIIYNGSTAHLHFAQNSIFLNAAMQRFFGSAVRPPNLPADRSAEQPDHCDINLSDYMASSGRIAESLLPKFSVITSEIVDEILLDLPVQCLLRLSAGSRALHRRATCDDVWKQLVEAQWPGGRMLCQHNILGHSLLDAFRRHKALLSVDPATQRGPLPAPLALWVPDDKQQYLMILELRYDPDVAAMTQHPNPDPGLLERVYASDAAPCVTSPPLSIDARLSGFLARRCLASTLQPRQKIRIPSEDPFNPDYLFFAVTIVRKRDAKCKRIFQYPSSSESLPRFAERSHSGTIYYALLFDCPTASELAHRAADPYMARVHYLSRPACGLQVHLGIALGSDGYEAECVEIYSYSDDGEVWEEGIR